MFDGLDVHVDFRKLRTDERYARKVSRVLQIRLQIFDNLHLRWLDYIRRTTQTQRQGVFEAVHGEFPRTLENVDMIWTNSIIYDENDIINGYHSDDVSVADSPDKGWGWLIDKNVDFIQTDWLLALKCYLASRENK